MNLDVEGGRYRGGRSSTTAQASPSRHRTDRPWSSDQAKRRSRPAGFVQRGRQLDVLVTRRSQIGGTGEQVTVRAVDVRIRSRRATATGGKRAAATLTAVSVTAVSGRPHVIGGNLSSAPPRQQSRSAAGDDVARQRGGRRTPSRRARTSSRHRRRPSRWEQAPARWSSATGRGLGRLLLGVLAAGGQRSHTDDRERASRESELPSQC